LIFELISGQTRARYREAGQYSLIFANFTIRCTGTVRYHSKFLS